MQVVTILGSPRKSGNTAAVLERFEESVVSPHRVQRIDLAGRTVGGCRGCDACQKRKEGPGCVQEDDAAGIFERLLAADAILYATPLYVWSFSAQLKALLDRQYCLVKYSERGSRSLLAGKLAALLVTCGGTAEHDADLIGPTFERAMSWGQCRVVGTYVVPGCTIPNRLGDAAWETARQIAEDLLGRNERTRDTKGGIQNA